MPRTTFEALPDGLSPFAAFDAMFRDVSQPFKPPVRVATTANITLLGTQTVDGVALAVDDRVLVKDQTDTTQNGIWVVSLGAWSRAVDFNAAGDVVNGTQVRVTSGDVNEGAVFAVTSANPIVIGTSAITFGVVARGPLPIVILCEGQSNPTHEHAYASFVPPPNLFVWNWDGTAGTVGTAFAAPPSGFIRVAVRAAAEVARAHPLQNVYLVTSAIGSLSISQWMAGASAPDMFANAVANVEAAIALVGVTTINYVIWYQGESPTDTPWTYPADFGTVRARYQAKSWYPRNTRVAIVGISPTSISGSIYTDAQNGRLADCVLAEPENRVMVYPSMLDAGDWADTLHPDAEGFDKLGAAIGQALLTGKGNEPGFDHVRQTGRGAVLGRPFRNMIRGSNFTTNLWALGTSFAAVADATSIATGWTWHKSGGGAVTIRRTEAELTMASVGVSTRHCLEIEVTTADATIGTTDVYCVSHSIPARTAALLGFGRTGALPATVSFVVAAPVTGNYFVTIQNDDRSRSITLPFTISVIDTPTVVVIPLPGDEAGAWIDDTSATGIIVTWTLAAGDTYLFTPSVWNTGDVRVGNVTRANAMATLGNKFRLWLPMFGEGVDKWPFEALPTDIDNALSAVNEVTVSFKTLDNTNNINIKANALTIEDQTDGDKKLQFDLSGFPEALTTGAPVVSVSGAIIHTTAAANALAIGRQGATDPALHVDASAANSITGIKVTSQATGAGADIEAAGETNVALRINAAGTGTISLGSASTGNIQLYRTVAMLGSSSGATTLAPEATASGALTAPSLTGTLVAHIARSAVAQTAHTGDTAETTLSGGTITVPADTLGANGRLRISLFMRFTGTAGTKTVRIKFNGTTFFEAANGATILSARSLAEIANRNATNSQVGGPLGLQGIGGSTNDVVTSAHDTTGALDITITGQLGNAGDSIAIASYLVEVLR